MTTAPRWLDLHWSKMDAPGSLLSGSLEERAEFIMRTVHAENDKLDDKKTIKPNLLKALALDLAAAASEQGKWLKPIERLLVLALGLSEDHEAGSWGPWSVKRRGRHKPEETDAWVAAHLIDSNCYRWLGKVKSQRAMERELRSQGFKTAQRRIGEWRRKAYGFKPEQEGYVPPDAPTMTPEEERTVPPFLEWRIKKLDDGITFYMPDEWPPD